MSEINIVSMLPAYLADLQLEHIIKTQVVRVSWSTSSDVILHNPKTDPVVLYRREYPEVSLSKAPSQLRTVFEEVLLECNARIQQRKLILLGMRKQNFGEKK